MERRGSNTWLVAVLAVAVGFLVALLIFGGDDNKNASATLSQTNATTTQTTGATGTNTAAAPGTTTATTAVQPTNTTAPQSPQRSVGDCINLWNQANNRGDQVFIVNLMSQQPIRVHVGITSDVPPKCLITVVANNGDAYVFPEGGGSTYPYAQAPGKSAASGLPPAEKTSNALEQGDGTLKAR